MSTDNEEMGEMNIYLMSSSRVEKTKEICILLATY